MLIFYVPQKSGTVGALNHRERSAAAEAQSVRRSPTFCRVIRYRLANVMWPSDWIKNSV